MKTVLTSLPVSAAVSTALKLPATTTPEGLGEKKKGVPILAKFSVTPVVRRYVVSVDRLIDATPDSVSAEVPNGKTTGASIQVIVVRGDGEKKESSTDEGITFTGSVKLPKADSDGDKK
jgi:hypothetical protein